MFYYNTIDLFYYLYIKKVKLLLLILIVFYIMKIENKIIVQKQKTILLRKGNKLRLLKNGIYIIL